MKKTLALLMAVLMVVGCFAGATAAESETYTGPDWEAIAEMDYDEASDALFEYYLSDYYAVYTEAKAETSDTNLRMALMAISDAKLMESGVFIPVTANGGNYAISRLVPRTVTTTTWGLSTENMWYTQLVCNELITAEDRTALTTLWSEAADEDEWMESAKAYLAENGYTLKDSYNFDNSYDLVTWDIFATSYTSDSYFIAATVSPLLTYDSKDNQIPALATSYEISEDGTVYTFHIREGVKWVDQQGREVGEVTANDWVTGLMHVADNNSELGYLLSSSGGCGIVNYDAFINGECDWNEVGVKAIDDYTLEYTLETPFPAFLSMLGYGCFMPLNYDYYKSQGGTFSAEGDEYTAGDYGTSPSNIAYCGAFLVTNFTEKNVTSYTANPTFYDADKMNITSINIYYWDGTDVLRPYNDLLSGVSDGQGLNSSAVVQAKEDKAEGSDESYFDVYSYISNTGATTYCGWVNLNRVAYSNYDDETKGVSEKSDEEKERTRAALANQNFRLAMAMAFDRGSFNGASVGEDLKYVSLRNSFTPGTFGMLTADTTVEINGVETTFPAGTYFGEIEQAQLDADGVPITVWDPTGNDGIGSGDGFDGWYNVDNAVAYLEKAIEELAQVGVEISEENPIYIDAPSGSYSETLTNQMNIYKQSIENALGGKVIVNLVVFETRADMLSCTYRYNSGDEANYDIAPSSSGWGPDYGDAQSYLDNIQPYGYMAKCIGLY